MSYKTRSLLLEFEHRLCVGRRPWSRGAEEKAWPALTEMLPPFAETPSRLRSRARRDELGKTSPVPRHEEGNAARMVRRAVCGRVARDMQVLADMPLCMPLCICWACMCFTPRVGQVRT